MSADSGEAPTLRILLLEDSAIDAELVTSHLARLNAPCELFRVTTRAEFIAALDKKSFDIVLADYSLPDFDGLTALDMVRAKNQSLPFIFVSGVVGEEFAINALRRGATDYVMKRGLSRLPAAVERATAEARERDARQRAQELLRLSETSAQLAIDAADLGKWEFDPRTSTLVLDARCRAMMGIDDDARLSQAFVLDRCHSTDRPRVERALMQAMNPTGSGKMSEEYRIVHDGAERWLSLSGRGFFNGQSCTRFLAMVADITDRKLAESALHELNQTLKLRVAHQTAEREHLWQLSKDLLAVLDEQGALVEVNPAWQSGLGYELADVSGRRFLDFIHPDDIAQTEQLLLRAPREKLRGFEGRFRAHDGSYRWIAWSASTGQGSSYLIGRDVTEDREASARLFETQEALRQAQKMEAVGQLTGGVAHDFNNLLQVVVGNLETLQRKLPQDQERLRRAADNAMAGARRAASLTQGLLAFSRRQPLNPKPVAVNTLVAGMSEMLARTLGELIDVRTRLDTRLWAVEVDENQLESTLLNLAVNARDAMPHGGTLSIETRNVAVKATDELTKDLRPGDYVFIRVVDTGTGMSPDVLARAFEPFFTTKSVGQGTGLGLSQVYGFVKQSGGVVKLDSTPGSGTSIGIYLQRFHGEVQPSNNADEVAQTSTMPHETILVVEDDSDVRAYTVETLRELGYQVLEARDGHSALRQLRHAPNGAIDLLFTDVVLPGGINGHQLAQQAQQMKPALKVLFATGYARDVIVHDGRLDAGLQLITKPFALQDLALKIRGVLEMDGADRHTH